MEVAIIEKDNALLAVRILTLLQREHVTVYELAKRSHIAESALQRICAGKAVNPSVWTIAAIAEVLGVCIDSLVHGE